MVEVHEPGAVPGGPPDGTGAPRGTSAYAGDEYVYWGFGAAGLRALARLAGLTEAHVDGTVVVDGHPRIMATLTRAC